MKAYRKKIKHRELYRQFLVLINSLLQFTDKELDVLALLLQIQEERIPVLGKSVDILSTDSRRLIMAETRVNKNNLSKYVRKMKDLDVVLKDDKGHYINDMFVPKIENGAIELLFVLEIKDENQSIT